MKDISMKQIKTMAFLFVVALSLTACGSTFEGAGKDIEKAGKWVQDTF